MSPNADWLRDEARSPWASERAHAAADPATSKEDLARLVNDPDDTVRKLALRNPAARNIAPSGH